MSTLSTNLYGSETSKGYTGLSGLENVDELVDKMSLGTKNKIDRQYQEQQKLAYKQADYREVSSKLLTFSNKYFSYSSGSTSNILSSSFFESNTIESSSKYVNLSGNADNIKNFSITDITGVATAASFASTKTVTKQNFSTNALTAYTSTLAGDSMSIEYDGKTYNLTIDRNFGQGTEAVTVQAVATELNEQIGKIPELSGKVEYGYTAGISQLTLTAGGDAKLTAASKDILSYLNMKVGNIAQSTAAVTAEQIDGLSIKGETVLSDAENQYMTFDFNGVSKTINMKEGIKTAAELQEHLKSELEKAYGKDIVKVTVDGDKLTFEAVGANESTDLFGVSDISDNLRNYIGIEPTTYNRINKTAEISKTNLATPLITSSVDLEFDDGTTEKGYNISVNGKEFKFKVTDTLTDIMKKINNNAEAGVNIYYSSTTDTFTVKSTVTGENSRVDIKDISGNLSASLFGSGANNLLNVGEYLEYDKTNDSYNIMEDINGTKTKLGTASYNSSTNTYTIDYDDGKGTDTSGSGAYKVTNGTDTEMSYTLNGGVPIKVTRSTATFSIDGINVELNEKAKDIDFTTAPVTFTVTNNSKEVAEKVKQFITDYNEIISLISTKTSQKPAKNCLPLTADQKKEMKEDEIKDWNIEAKKGMVFGDSKLNNVLYSLRSAMAGKTSVSSLVLSNMGISVASYDTSGKLNFDEEKFKAKLAQNPDEVVALFTGSSSNKDSVSGIALQIQSILKANVGTAGLTGILIDEAGMSNSMTSDSNNISEKIDDDDDKLKQLKKDYAAERQRYYNKFTALEKAITSLNSQSSALTSMLGS